MIFYTSLYPIAYILPVSVVKFEIILMFTVTLIRPELVQENYHVPSVIHSQVDVQLLQVWVKIKMH